ncbi:LysR family transcriptional regulator [Bradyrhizobium sp. Pear77]|nr:LysR family transcriptional regulator [Bradyrhizobium altum]
MTLKQLEAFYWAATCTNFAIAAQRLNLSISSLSKRVAELEISLGTTLFDRSGHRAILTQAGQDLLARSIHLLDLAANIKRSMTKASGLSGYCAFGVGELSAMTWLPSLVASARRHHPNLHLDPCVDVGATLEDRLNHGELDFAIIAGRSSRHGIMSQPFVEAEFVWMAASSLAGDDSTCAALLKRGVPLIALPPLAGTTQLIDDWLNVNQITHVERISCNNWSAIVGMLTLSVGVGIVPSGWAERLADKGVLRRLADKNLLAPLAYSFQWRRDDTRPLVKEMRELVRITADFLQAVSFA